MEFINQLPITVISSSRRKYLDHYIEYRKDGEYSLTVQEDI